MSDGISEKELAALFMETGKHHHAADKAFQATGKEYMEWPAFYANLCLEKFKTS